MVAVALLALSHVWVVRWDMTDDRHYSLSEASKALLRQTDAPIAVTLLLDGDLNAGFRRLKKATEECLEEFDVYAQITNHQSPIRPTPSASRRSSFTSGSKTARPPKRPFIRTP